MELEHDVFDEFGAFEPPVAEEFGIECRGDDAVATSFFVVIPKALFDGIAEMLGVFVNAWLDVFGVVEFFVAEVHFVAGDFPVA